MSYRVSSVREKLKEVNWGLGSVGGGLLAGAFGELDGKLGSVQDSIDGYTSRLNRYSHEFNEISEDVEQIEGEMDWGWKRSLDEEAALKLIYCLLGFISIGIIIAIITLLTDFREKMKEGAMLYSSVKQGISMSFGSISVGILIIAMFFFHVITKNWIRYIMYETSIGTFKELTIKIHLLSPHIVYAYQILIFILYFICIIIIFEMIIGFLIKRNKFKYMMSIYMGNYAGLIVMLVLFVVSGYAAVPSVGLIAAIITLPILLFGSITGPFVLYLMSPMNISNRIFTAISLLFISIFIPLMYSAHYLYTLYMVISIESIQLTGIDPLFIALLNGIVAIIESIVVIGVYCFVGLGFVFDDDDDY